MDRQATLLQLLDENLTESQGRLYLALLRQPQMTATQIGLQTSFPRSNLYALLNDLHAMGLVEIRLQGKTRWFRARPFNDFRAHRIRELRRAADELEERLEDGMGLAPPPIEADDDLEGGGEVRLLSGRRSVQRAVAEALANAKEGVVLAASSESLGRLAPMLLSELRAWSIDGPLLEIYAPHADALRPFAQFSRVIARVLPVRPNTFSVCVDDRWGMFVHASPDDASASSGHDFGIVSEEASFVMNHQSLQRLAAKGYAHQERASTEAASFVPPATP